MTHLLQMHNETEFSPGQIDFLKNIFPPTIHSRAAQYRRWQDRQAFLGGRYLLLIGLKKFNLPHNLFYEIKYTVHGRPYLPGRIDFNISHSGNFILCVISDEHRVGIDIEEVREIDINDFKGQFTELEFLKISQAENRYAEFFKYWSRKEAVIKADGRGLSLNLNSILIGENSHIEGCPWYIREIIVSSEYMAYMVSDSVINDQITCEVMTIPEL